MKTPRRDGSSSFVQSVRYPVRWLLLSLAAILCIAFFPYIFEGKIFLPTDTLDTMTSPFNTNYGPPQSQNFYLFDGIVQTYPWKVAAQKALRSGHLAYWNPHILCGYPQYAETVGDNFDVFNLLGLWLGPWQTILTELLLELFIAGAGMCLLLRWFGVKAGANLIFSTAYMLNSLFIVIAMSRWYTGSFCWIPFVILMLASYVRNGNKEDLVYAGLFLALSYLGGTLQTAFYITCVVACLVLFYPSEDRSFLSSRRIGLFFALFLFSFALSSPMWLPTLQLFIQTLSRGSLNSTSVYEHYTIVQRFLSLPLLLTFYFPGITGSPEIFNLKKFAGADATDFNGAITFVPMLFAAWGCFALRKRKEFFPFILLAVCAILLPILTPLYSILYHRVFVVATFCFSIVGAVMFQSFIDNELDQNRIVRILKRIGIAFGCLAASLIVLCGYVTFQRQPLERLLTEMLRTSTLSTAFGSGSGAWVLARLGKTLDYYSFTSIGLWLPIILAAIATIAIYRYAIGKMYVRPFLWITGIATLIPLILFVRMWLPSIDPDKFPIYPVNPVTSFLQIHSQEGRFMVCQDLAKDAYVLHPNISNVYGINYFEGYESLNPGTMSVLYRKQISPDSIDLRLLGLANVRYIVTRSHVMSDSNARPVFSADGLTVYENLRAKPREYFVSGIEVLASDSVITRELLQKDFDGSTALISREDAPVNLEGSYSTIGVLQIRDSGNEAVVIQARTPEKSLLVLTDTYYPGWRCYVNGVPQPIYRVNNYMRGISLDAGKSEIVFRFEPDIFTAGMSLSGIAAVLALGSIMFFKIRRYRSISSRPTARFSPVERTME
jgi:hypothetical protein